MGLPFFTWPYVKKWLSYFMALSLLLALAVFFLGKRERRLDATSLATKQLWEKWSSSTVDPEEATFLKLQRAVSKKKSAAFYKPKIAQRLLAQKSAYPADLYVDHSIKRTALHPYYAAYAKTSLVIGEKNYFIALEEATLLKKQLIENPLFLQADDNSALSPLGFRLFLFNLLRIAFLSKELGKEEEELSAWEEFTSYCQLLEGESRKKEEELISHFTIREKSLLDYIEKRKQLLKSSS